jgi:hypothetical protein
MRYRAIAQMSRLLKLQPSEAAQQVAEKAAFSQHTISREELKLLGTEIAQLQTQLKKRNFLLQIVYTLVLALY